MSFWKKELTWLGENLKAALLGAFLAAFGGVLLWVSGGSGWYSMKQLHAPLPSLPVLFALSLLRDGFCGMSASLAASYCKRCGGGGFPHAVGWIGAAYLFGLGWYAVYFCTRMTFFGAVLLAAALAFFVAAELRLRKGKMPASVHLTLLAAAAADLFFFIMTLLSL